MSGFQGSISYNSKAGAPAGFINVAGARNGTSIDSGSFVVLGQNIGAVGSPADLLSNREINMKTFYANWFGGQTVISDVSNAGDATTPLQVVSGGGPFSNLLTLKGTSVAGGLIQFQQLGQSFWSDSIGEYLSTQGINVNAGPLPGSPYLLQAVANLFPSSGTAKARQIACIGQWAPTGGSNAFTAFTVENAISAAGAGEIHAFHANWAIISVGTGRIIGFENDNGDNYFNSSAGTTGRTGFQRIRTPTAWVHIGAGAAAASSAPLKFTGGTVLTTPEAGAMEYSNAGQLFFTPATGVRNQVLIGNSGAAAPATTAGVAFTSFFGSSITTVMGTPNNWISCLINGTTFKIPLYT
jgi:hypothetical protein